MQRRLGGWVAVTLVALAMPLALLGCGSSSTSSTSNPGGSTAVADKAAFCAAAFEQLSPQSPGADTVKDPATVKAEAQRLAATAPAEIAADAATWVAANSVDPSKQPTNADLQQWIIVGNRLLAFVARTCPDGGPYWNCLGPRTEFQGVSSAIDDKGPPATQVFDKGATPEQAVAKKPTVKGAERTEQHRDAQKVIYVWVNAYGRLLQRVVVTKQADEWVAGNAAFCP